MTNENQSQSLSQRFQRIVKEELEMAGLIPKPEIKLLSPALESKIKNYIEQVQAKVPDHLKNITFDKPFELVVADRFHKAIQKRIIYWRESDQDESVIAQEIDDLFEMATLQTWQSSPLDQLLPRNLFLPNSTNERRWQRMPLVIMELFAFSPELAKEICNRKIVAAHGSTSAALQGFFKYGLRPQRHLKDQGELVASGAFDQGAELTNQLYVSTFVIAELYKTLDYAQPHPTSEEYEKSRIDHLGKYLASLKDVKPNSFIKLTHERHQNILAFLQKKEKTEEEREKEQLIREGFPIIFLVTSDSLTTTGTPQRWNRENPADALTDYSETNELMIKDGRSRDQVPIILVPSEKVEYTKNLAKKYGWVGKVFDIAAVGRI